MTLSQSLGFGIPRHTGDRSFPSKKKKKTVGSGRRHNEVLERGTGPTVHLQCHAVFSGRFTRNQLKKRCARSFLKAKEAEQQPQKKKE